LTQIAQYNPDESAVVALGSSLAGDHESREALLEAALRRFADLGLEPAGNSPQQYAAFIKAEIEKVAKIAKAIGLQPE
jgi:hypothetical protein